MIDYKKRTSDMIRQYTVLQWTMVEIADEHGLTYQRVQQILTKNKISMRPRGTRPVRIYLVGTPCKICKRKRIKSVDVMGDLCRACYAYARTTRTRTHIRTILYPKNCIECGKPIPRGTIRRARKCNTCYCREAQRAYYKIEKNRLHINAMQVARRNKKKAL